MYNGRTDIYKKVAELDKLTDSEAESGKPNCQTIFLAFDILLLGAFYEADRYQFYRVLLGIYYNYKSLLMC